MLQFSRMRTFVQKCPDEGERVLPEHGSSAVGKHGTLSQGRSARRKTGLAHVSSNQSLCHKRRIEVTTRDRKMISSVFTSGEDSKSPEIMVRKVSSLKDHHYVKED